MIGGGETRLVIDFAGMLSGMCDVASLFCRLGYLYFGAGRSNVITIIRIETSLGRNISRTGTFSFKTHRQRDTRYIM